MKKLLEPRRLAVGVLAGGLLCTGAMHATWAELTLDSYKAPLPMQLNTDLNVKTVRSGDSFSGVLKEDARFQEYRLPAGTVFSGVVHASRQSYSFALPGYVMLQIEQAQLPSGAVHPFSHSTDSDAAVQTRKLMHPKAQTYKRLVCAMLPFAAVSVANTVPLSLATNLTNWQIFPISLGARMTLGAGMELSNKRQQSLAHNQSAVKRLGYGALIGTGLTGMYYYLHPSPEPDLAAGATVPLYFNESDFMALFRAADAEAPGLVRQMPMQSEAMQSAELKDSELKDSPTDLAKNSTLVKNSTKDAPMDAATGYIPVNLLQGSQSTPDTATAGVTSVPGQSSADGQAIHALTPAQPVAPESSPSLQRAD